ncbi:MAG TPA: hypothetical protein VGX24_04700 [Pyrinomonadaceae bacterium]|jgi:hypothetical protein|nr:hypothetical protein [Pyrinomonadaceae bacterium]
MAIRKLNNQRTDARLLLEADEPVELPPAEIEEGALVVQFDNVRPFLPELLETLRAGTIAELVPVMLDGSTFAIHTQTRTFWVKLWHANGGDLSRIERAQVLSCLPSTRGLQVIVGDEDDDDDDDFDDDDEFGEEDFDEDDDDDDEGGAPVNPQPES